MAVKMPSGHAANQSTDYPQDFINFPFDRVGFLTFWFALSDMPPERDRRADQEPEGLPRRFPMSPTPVGPRWPGGEQVNRRMRSLDA
jgi:hypothetical protein